jgi:hypothetical protein
MYSPVHTYLVTFEVYLELAWPPGVMPVASHSCKFITPFIICQVLFLGSRRPRLITSQSRGLLLPDSLGALVPIGNAIHDGPLIQYQYQDVVRET